MSTTMRWATTTKPDGRLHFVLENDRGMTLLRTSHPALIFDSITGRVYKFGDIKRVQEYLIELKHKMSLTGRTDDAVKLVLLSSSSISVDELNRACFEESYCLTLYARIIEH